MGLSGLCSPHGHSRQFGFRSTVSHASTFLSPFAPRPLRRFSARMRTVTPRGVSLHPLPRSPRFTSPIPLRPFCLQPPHAPHRRFCTLPLSSMGFPRTGLGFATVPQARRDMRPNRVRPPADWSLTSGCSPSRLTATQFPSVSGRRAFAWRGLAPLWMSALTGARNAGVSPAGAVENGCRRRRRRSQESSYTIAVWRSSGWTSPPFSLSHLAPSHFTATAHPLILGANDDESRSGIPGSAAIARRSR